jgi:hypothetical protein
VKLSHDFGPEPLKPGPEDNRDYLRGQPVHCGTLLHLQVLDGQPFDGRNFIVVRYERSALNGRSYFIVCIGGHDATIGNQPWMRLWWPE